MGEGPKKIIGKVVECVIYYIVMYVLICTIIHPGVRQPLLKLTGYAIAAALIIAIFQMILGGGDEYNIFNTIGRRVTFIIVAIYAVCFLGCLAFESFGDVFKRIMEGALSNPTP